MVAESKWSASDMADSFTPFTQPIISVLADDNDGDDGDDDACSPGFACIPGDEDGPCPAGFTCEEECDDDGCELKECEFDGVDDGDDTDDGICAMELLCDFNDPLACDDGNVCTDDTCDPATGCVNTNNVASCDDSNACTTGDACSAGACVSGPAADCNDENPCTADSCSAESGCQNDPVLDGTACTIPDGTGGVCTDGLCMVSPQPMCEDACFLDFLDCLSGGDPMLCEDVFMSCLEGCGPPPVACGGCED